MEQGGGLTPGSRIGPYVLLDRLGAGGMGQVFRARHEPTGALRALKVLQPDAIDLDLLLRFQREGRAQAAADHPHVLRIHEAGRAGPYAFLALELAEGGDLEGRLEGGERLEPREAATLLAQLVRGLEHLHAQGIIHRDVKPANVLFDAEGTPKLADLGLARVGAGSLTETGALLGTPAYMSPEQARGARDLDARSDVFALGVLAYRLLTGRLPFPGETPYAVLRAVLERQPTPPRALAPEVPADLEAICLRCLAKRPEGRYPSARALAEDLERVARGEALAAPGTRRRRRALVVVAAATTALAALAIAAATKRERADPAVTTEAPAQAPKSPAPPAPLAEALAPPPLRPPDPAAALAELKARLQSGSTLPLLEVHGGPGGTLAGRRIHHEARDEELALTLASARGSGEALLLWSPRSGLPHRLPIALPGAQAAGLLPDRPLALVAQGARLTVVPIASGAPRPPQPLPFTPQAVAGLPGAQVLLLGAAGELARWDLQTAQTVWQREAGAFAGGALTASRDGRLALLRSRSGEPSSEQLWALWDVTAGRPLTLTGRVPPPLLSAVALSADGSTLLAGAGRRLLRRRIGAPGEDGAVLLSSLGSDPDLEASILGCALGPDGTRGAALLREPFVESDATLVWDFERRACGRLVTLEPAWPLVFAGLDRALSPRATWDLRRLEPLLPGAALTLPLKPAAGNAHELTPTAAAAHAGPVLAIAPAPQRPDCFLTLGGDGRILRWRAGGRDRTVKNGLLSPGPLATNDDRVLAFLAMRLLWSSGAGGGDARLHLEELPQPSLAHLAWLDGETALSVGRDGALAVHHLGDEERIFVPPSPLTEGGGVLQCRLDASRRELLVVLQSGELLRCVAQPGQPLKTAWLRPSVAARRRPARRSASFSAAEFVDGERVIAAETRASGSGTRLVVLDRASLEERGEASVDPLEGASVRFLRHSPQEGVVLAASHDLLSVWTLQGDPLGRVDLAAADDLVTAVAFAPGSLGPGVVLGTQRGRILRFGLPSRPR